MSKLFELDPIVDEKVIKVIIEISQGSYPVKYEVDKDLGALVVDRIIPVAMHYPCNYGFIPSTLGQDGDALDALLISPYPIREMSLIDCRVIGALNMEDESGKDEKILVVPSDSVSKKYSHIKDIDSLEPYIKDQIKHFFENYKGLENNKWVKVLDWTDSDEAMRMIDVSRKQYLESK